MEGRFRILNYLPYSLRQAALHGENPLDAITSYLGQPTENCTPQEFAFILRAQNYISEKQLKPCIEATESFLYWWKKGINLKDSLEVEEKPKIFGV